MVGSVELFYQRSAKFGFGNVKCWVDDDRDKFEVIEGYWDLQFNIVSDLGSFRICLCF